MVTMVADSAMEQARAADKARASGEELGPLHGLPVAIKDLHDTAGISRPKWRDLICRLLILQVDL